MRECTKGSKTQTLHITDTPTSSLKYHLTGILHYAVVNPFLLTAVSTKRQDFFFPEVYFLLPQNGCQASDQPKGHASMLCALRTKTHLRTSASSFTRMFQFRELERLQNIEIFNSKHHLATKSPRHLHNPSYEWQKQLSIPFPGQAQLCQTSARIPSSA